MLKLEFETCFEHHDRQTALVLSPWACEWVSECVCEFVYLAQEIKIWMCCTQLFPSSFHFIMIISHMIIAYKCWPFGVLFFCLFFSGGKSSEKQKRKKHLLLAWLCVWLSVCMTNWCNLYHSCSVEHHWLNNTFFFLFFCFVLVSLSIFIDNLWYQVCQLMKNHIQMI